MKNVMNKINAFIADEKGGEVVEWAIVVSIMAAIAVVSYTGTLGATIATSIAFIESQVLAAA